MCGLVGIYGREMTTEDTKVFRDLLLVSSVRGRDSTGVAFARRNKDDVIESDVWKDTLTSSEFIKEYDRPNSLLRETSLNLFMGHTRDTTVGQINKENAHPFRTRNLIGAHNGTMLDFKYRNKKKTDSALLIDDISEKGLIPVLEDADEYSAYALSLFSLKDGSLTLTRNKERTLYFAVNVDRPVVYWASELGMLTYVLGRHRINVTDRRYSVTPFRPITFQLDFDHKQDKCWTYDKVKEPVGTWNGHFWGYDQFNSTDKEQAVG